MEDQISGHRATHAFRDLKHLRMRLKPRTSQAKLARASDVSEDTLRKAERGVAVTESVARAIYEALAKQLVELTFEQVVHPINPSLGRS